MIRLAPVRARQCWWWHAFLLPLVVAGCASRDVIGKLPTESQPPFSAGGEIAVPDRWWTSFNNPDLNLQVNQAFDGSFTLAAALQRLAAARALARREASDLWPDLDGVADIGSLFGPGRDPTVYRWGLDTSYQVDLWGQIRSRVDAQRLRAQATSADYHAIALTLSAEIARTWFSLIEAHAQAVLIDQQIETNRNGLKAQELRFGLAGLVRSPDVLRQRQLVESTLEQSVIVQARIEVLEHQLAVLLGQPPQEAKYDPGTTLPKLPPLPDTGLPADLLRRRPDVRRDFLALMAADRDLASAISARYPRLSLTGTLENIANSPENLFRDWFVGIGAQLIGPLIDGGQRRAEVDRTAAVVRQRFNEYGQTMLNAFREVEDSLALERRQLERIQHLEAQLELARQSSNQLREQYLIGDADYLDVLSAITSQQRLQRDTLTARLELLLFRIALYLALAGDIDPNPQNIMEIQDVPAAEQLSPEPANRLEELPMPEAGQGAGLLDADPAALAADLDSNSFAATNSEQPVREDRNPEELSAEASPYGDGGSPRWPVDLEAALLPELEIASEFDQLLESAERPAENVVDE